MTLRQYLVRMAAGWLVVINVLLWLVVTTTNGFWTFGGGTPYGP